MATRGVPACAPAVAGILLVLGLAGCGPRRSVVTIEEPGTASLPPTIHPPVCAHAPLPDYPDAALHGQAPETRVMVKLRIDKDGRIDNIRTEATPSGPHADLFQAASREAVGRWECTAATQFSVVNDPTGDGFVPVTYDTSVVFVFSVEKGRGRVRR